MTIVMAWWEPTAAVPVAPRFAEAEVRAAFGAARASLLGAGAFGETWRLSSPGSADVAVKLLFNPDYPRERLDREAEGLRRANSEYVVALRDVVQVDIAQADRPALVFEFIDGGDVADRLQQGAVVDPASVREFARGLLTGIAALHAGDAVHRDIKPENIALRGGDWSQPVLLDLGLVKMLDQQSLTAYPALMGTVPFMAPEQLMAARARRLADVFATGVVLYIMLTGAHPFYGPRSDAVDQTRALELMEAGPKLFPVGLPSDLQALVERLLSYEAHRRGSAARALRDLS